MAKTVLLHPPITHGGAQLSCTVIKLVKFNSSHSPHITECGHSIINYVNQYSILSKTYQPYGSTGEGWKKMFFDNRPKPHLEEEKKRL